MSRTLRTARLLAASALASAFASALVVATGAPTQAVPDGGAASDTPGTSSSVTPKTLAPGDRITFTVKGFPGGETIYVKIDDGANCADTTQGGCVYHQQKIPSSGTVTGSFTLPKSLSEGKHWLRFLASKQVFNAAGEFQGIEGYTLRKGSDFTVAKASAAGSAASAGSGTAASAGQPAAAAPSAEVTQDTATLSLGAASSAANGSAQGSTNNAAAPAAAAPVAAAPAATTTVQTISTPRPIPVIGIIVLSLAIALAAAALGFVVARTGRRSA